MKQVILIKWRAKSPAHSPSRRARLGGVHELSATLVLKTHNTWDAAHIVAMKARRLRYN
jgi:hypothetical protein